MFLRCFALACVGLLCAAATVSAQQAADPIDAESLKDVLRTRDDAEVTYLTYVAALAAHGDLSRELVTGTMQWARGKPFPKRVQYFKQALIHRAAQAGITLPQGTPSLTGTIDGTCYVRVLLVNVPAAGITVTLGDTKRTAVTDIQGRFRFENVPYGVYSLNASGVVTLVTRRGTTNVAIPSPPPSTAAATATIVLQ